MRLANHLLAQVFGGEFNNKHESYNNGSDSFHFLRDENLLYSYRLPLVYRSQKGFGAGINFVINGDKSTHTTSQHRSLCLRYCRPNVQIPFSALRAAGIEINRNFSIVAWADDQTKVICKECNEELQTVNHYDNYIHRHDNPATTTCPNALLTINIYDYTDDDKKFRTEHLLGGVVIRYKRKYYLSAVDPQEAWGHGYFLCQLSRPVKTVQEAFESLKPSEVLFAEQAGIKIKRQGDVFAIEYKGEIPRPKDCKSVLKMHPLFTNGTDSGSHVATQARITREGQTLIAGCLYHRPAGRRPDHKRVSLTDAKWWIPVKNTAVAGWSAIGNID